MLRAPPVLLLLFLAICGLLSPSGVQAQGTAGAQAQSKGFRLEQNYPNPANPDTYIPYYLEETLFADGAPRLVSVRIVNMFGELVAIPRGVGHPRGGNVPGLNRRYPEPGRTVAYWNGRDMNGRAVPTAVYFVVLQVGTQVEYSRMSVTAPRRRPRFFPFFRRRGD